MIFITLFVIQILRLSMPYEVNLDPSNWPKITKICAFSSGECICNWICVTLSALHPCIAGPFYIPAVSMGNHWNTKISAITWFQQIFSQFARKLPFSEKIKHIYKKLYTKRFYTLSSSLYPRFSRMFLLFARKRGFHNFWVFMAYYHLA